MMRTIVAFTLLCCLLVASNAQQTTKPSRPATQQSAAAAPGAVDSGASPEELQRMKSLVQQMQTNLAFVTSIQGPLKHQFELEIEMWQMEIARLERHKGSSSAARD